MRKKAATRMVAVSTMEKATTKMMAVLKGKQNNKNSNMLSKSIDGMADGHTGTGVLQTGDD